MVHEGGLDKLDILYPLVDLPALVLLQVVPGAKIQGQFKSSSRTILNPLPEEKIAISKLKIGRPLSMVYRRGLLMQGVGG